MTERHFVQEVAGALRCDPQRAESMIFAVFQELRHRLTVREAAERGVRAGFRGLQRLLGSPKGREGEAWHVFGQLPKDLKQLWLDAARD